MKHKNGHWVWILDRGRVYAHDKDGSPLLMAGTHQDITAQKIHEQEILIAKQNAEEATQLKDKFVNLVSHDLKNPLGLIINYLNLALKKISPVDERDLSTLLKRAQSGAFLMNSLIHDILSLSRFKSGRIKLDTKFFLFIRTLLAGG
ncbi:MAG: hypothetical protein BroJett040_07810 [Oligoflexia bacterium]|nr:MAG: hypothetical protein BroJett040_07810 [Oligoflexia bacterium]